MRYKNKIYIIFVVGDFKVKMQASLMVMSLGDLKILDWHAWKIQNLVRKFIACRRVQKLRLTHKKWLSEEMPKLYHANELRVNRRQKWSIREGLSNSGNSKKNDDDDISTIGIYDKIYQSLQFEERLFERIHNMVQNVKLVAEKHQQIPFDVVGIRQAFMNWSHQLPHGDLRSTVGKVSKKINYGHLLLQPLNLVPLVGMNKLAVVTLRTSLKRRIHSVKHANGVVDSTHNLFIKIYKLKAYLQVIYNLSSHRYKNEVEVIRLSQSIDTKQTIHAKENAFLYGKLMHLSEILIKYYDNYIKDIVNEYGVDSSYRKAYNDRKDQYLFDFGELINQNQPLQKYGLSIYMTDSNLNQLDICVDFHLKTNSNYINNHVELYDEMYYRYMPSNCGLDYAMNSVCMLMYYDKINISQCLLRIDGKDIHDV